MRWIAKNVALFAAVQVVYVALLALVFGAPGEVGATLLAVAALFTVPFLPIYLAVIAALPRTWTGRARRVAAVAASPMLAAIFVIGAFVGGPGPFLLGLALPGALAYGAFVRLPSHLGPPPPASSP